MTRPLIAAAALTMLLGCSPNNAQTAAPAPLAAPAAASAGTPTPGIQLPDFSALVERDGKAVVNISTTQAVKGRNRRAVPGIPNLPDDEALQEFFRRFFPFPPGGGEEGDELPPGHPPTQSLGSGFIVSTDGIILTNAHVIANADEVTVKLNDKREFKAKVLGLDKRTDVAVLKIEATNLPIVPVGDPDKLRVGEWVLAIGSPFGFENSVTAGIVSAKGRSLPDETYVPFIQTDVAINPGNSGGPLFNLKGEVVGINAQIYSRSGGYMGLSFAIPIDVAMKVADQLRSTGKVSRGRIGVAIQEVNSELAQSFGLDKAQGALVSGVEKGSPADKAGIKAGDIILAFDGKSVGSSRELPAIVGQTKPGARAKVEVWRGGKKVTLDITVGELDGDKPVRAAAPAPEASGRFGLALVELPEEQRSKLEIPGGVLVRKAEGEAAKAGIRTGDVIVAINNSAVTSPAQVAELLKAVKKGQSVALLIRREDRSLFVPLVAKE